MSTSTMRKDFFVIKSESERILFHAPTFNFTAVNDNFNLDDLTDQDIYDISNINDLLVVDEPDCTYGKGKIGVTFMSSRQCNLSCKYCFAENGEYGNREDKPKASSSSLYMDTIKFVMENMYPDGISSISFFGGEPLINYKQIELFIEKCKNYFIENNWKIPIFAISTNSILINDEMLTFFKKHNVQIGLSLDGIKTINDSARYSERRNLSVYEEVVKKVNKLKEYGIDYAFQMTINKNHLDVYKDGMFSKWMRELDVFDGHILAIVPVTSDEDSFGITSEEDLSKLDTLSREIANFYINEIFTDDSKKIAPGVVAPIIQIAKRKMNSSCSAGHSIFVDTDGEIYPCHMFCNDDHFSLGNINSELLNHASISNNINIKRKEGEACKHCIAQNVCSIWCKGLQYLNTGDMHNVLKERCVFQRAIFEECIKTLYKLKNDSEKMKILSQNLKRMMNMVRE